jgi:hypothetical protein
MKRQLAFAVFLLALASALPSSAAQTRLYQPPRDTVVHEGTAVIKGRIVEAGSNQPVRKARVHAASPALKDGRTAYTDANGAFELTALPAGHYTVTAGKLGFVPAAYGQAKPLEAGLAIDLPEGKTLTALDFGMSRAGVITGRITDEFGEPLADTTVSAMRYQGANGGRRLVSAGTRRTNDIGEFRVFGLLPGQYYLAATLPNVGPPQINGAPTDVYAATYYPGTASASTAQALTIATGQTIAGVNMMLLPVRSVSVSGSVVDSNRNPLKNAAVMARFRVGAGGYATSGVKPDGTFTLAGLSPGDYIVQVRIGGGLPGNSESATLALTVGPSDMTDVHIVTSQPTRVSGRVHIDPAELGSLPGSTFHLSSPPASPDDVGIRGNATTIVKDDFTFQMGISPGRVFIRSNTAGWFLRAVKINGIDVIDSGVEILPNTPLTGVEIELTHKQPELSGVVSNAAGEPTRSAFIVVFPQNRELWGYLSRYVRMVRPNPDSKYRVLVPPGEYFVVALETMDPTAVGDPDFLDRMRNRALVISLRDGDHKTLDLGLVPVPQQ